MSTVPKNQPSRQGERLLTFASYNIHRCVVSDGRQDPAWIRQVVRRLDADVIAWQEVEVSPGTRDLLEYFCENS